MAIDKETVKENIRILHEAEVPASFDSRTTVDLQEEESILHNRLMVFGTDVGQIPCFRNSFLYGIGGGIGTGIVHFAVSSRLRAATTFGFWTYVGVTISYWCKCRYEYTMTKLEYTKLQYALKHAIAAEGTKDQVKREATFD